MAAAASLYVHLWIVEGAVRKWLPALDSLMYFARDAVVIAAVVIGVVASAPRKRFRTWGAIFWLYVGVLASYALIQGIVLQVNLPVLLLGIRNYVAPMLLIYLVVRERDKQFPERLARIVFFYIPIQAALVIVQVLSPKDSWINVQPGGDEAYFTTAGGIVRASGSFSAPAGLILFTTLGCAITLAAISGAIVASRVMVAVALLSIIGIVALGGSRGAVLNVAILLAAWVAQSLVSGSLRRLMSVFSGMALILFAGVITAWIVPGVVEAFLTRFTTAAGQEDSLQRLGSTIFGFHGYLFSILGDGAGTRSASGIALGSSFNWVEGDSDRWVAELGLLGFAMSVIRLVTFVVLSLVLFARFRSMPALSLLLGVAICIILSIGAVTTQPSTQGYFGIVVSAFVMSIPRQTSANTTTGASGRSLTNTRTS